MKATRPNSSTCLLFTLLLTVLLTQTCCKQHRVGIMPSVVSPAQSPSNQFVAKTNKFFLATKITLVIKRARSRIIYHLIGDLMPELRDLPAIETLMQSDALADLVEVLGATAVKTRLREMQQMRETREVPCGQRRLRVMRRRWIQPRPNLTTCQCLILLAQ